MNKFYGAVGYCTMVESAPDVWIEEIVERKYAGDVQRMSRRLQGGDTVNNNLSVSNQISIVSDPYAYQHFHEIRYVEWSGVKWKVTTVDVQYPRLILTLGEIYHGEEQA